MEDPYIKNMVRAMDLGFAIGQGRTLCADFNCPIWAKPHTPEQLAACKERAERRQRLDSARLDSLERQS
jgi:hypothetical protein